MSAASERRATRTLRESCNSQEGPAAGGGRSGLRTIDGPFRVVRYPKETLYRIEDAVGVAGTPAGVRFLSVEPMLGPVDKRQYHKIESPETEAAFWRSIEWDLKQSRRWGRWEGADVAPSILRPHVRTEGRK